MCWGKPAQPAYIPSEAQGSEPQNQKIVDEPGGHVTDEDEQPQEVVAYEDEEPQDDGLSGMMAPAGCLCSSWGGRCRGQQGQ